VSFEKNWNFLRNHPMFFRYILFRRSHIYTVWISGENLIQLMSKLINTGLENAFCEIPSFSRMPFESLETSCTILCIRRTSMVLMKNDKLRKIIVHQFN